MRSTSLAFGVDRIDRYLLGPVRAGAADRPGGDVANPPPEVARLRPFVCVGLAYFLIGVIVAGLWLHLAW